MGEWVNGCMTEWLFRKIFCKLRFILSFHSIIQTYIHSIVLIRKLLNSKLSIKFQSTCVNNIFLIFEQQN